MATRKTWAEKMKTPAAPEVKRTEKAFTDIPEHSLMLIPTPVIIDAYIKQIPKGRAMDVTTLRNDLAAEHHAAKTCPLTTGIFLRIVAEAAWEEHVKGKALKNITPFWRVIDERSKVAAKLACGAEKIAELRKREGILPQGRIKAKGV
ncbi:MAG TPA: hypothetical protein PKM63_10940 [Panacibacter sp.]|nr:hypothetical protein [Panacibacter sp.]HNP44795.1 hypothetical protein [Panacibacter sp.]